MLLSNIHVINYMKYNILQRNLKFLHLPVTHGIFKIPSTFRDPALSPQERRQLEGNIKEDMSRLRRLRSRIAEWLQKYSKRILCKAGLKDTQNL